MVAGWSSTTQRVALAQGLYTPERRSSQTHTPDRYNNRARAQNQDAFLYLYVLHGSVTPDYFAD